METTFYYIVNIAGVTTLLALAVLLLVVSILIVKEIICNVISSIQQYESTVTFSRESEWQPLSWRAKGKS